MLETKTECVCVSTCLGFGVWVMFEVLVMCVSWFGLVGD